MVKSTCGSISILYSVKLGKVILYKILLLFALVTNKCIASQAEIEREVVRNMSRWWSMSGHKTAKEGRAWVVTRPANMMEHKCMVTRQPKMMEHEWSQGKHRWWSMSGHKTTKDDGTWVVTRQPKMMEHEWSQSKQRWWNMSGHKANKDDGAWVVTRQA